MDATSIQRPSRSIIGTRISQQKYDRRARSQREAPRSPVRLQWAVGESSTPIESSPSLEAGSCIYLEGVEKDRAKLPASRIEHYAMVLLERAKPVKMIQLYCTVLLFLLSTALCADWSASCPLNCICKWSNGKKSAICNGAALTAVPSNLSTEIQVLVLNDNSIPYLNREEFTTLGLANLQKIHLKHSRVRYLHREAFKNLKILVEVDLSANEIETLDKQTFAGNNRLRIINLYDNPLKMLVAEQFPVLPYLRNIDLHGCQLRYVAETAFSNLDLLELLDLSKNRLESLPHHVFNHMRNLKTLVLEENWWNCDCHLRDFRGWYLESALNRRSLHCQRPAALQGLSWEYLTTEQFGCMPTVDVYRDEYELEDLGTNVTYKCVVSGDPEPTVRWDVNGRDVDQGNAIVETERHVALDGSVTHWSNLTILNVTSNDAGFYTCTATNRVGLAARNLSLVLPEVVERVIIKTPETFWYFGLILGIFGTIFGLLALSVAVCLVKRKLRMRRRRKTIKNSVSFNDQEKKLLDLSITTNERQEFSASDAVTPSTKTDSTIALEPVQITIESIATAAKREEYPLNVGVFPPPPEFCAQMLGNPTFSNIYISVSVTQDPLEGADVNMYPDLLNIPNRHQKGPPKMAPVSVASYATLPRKQGGGGGGGGPRCSITSGHSSGSSGASTVAAAAAAAVGAPDGPMPLTEAVVNYATGVALRDDSGCEMSASPVPSMCAECSQVLQAKYATGTGARTLTAVVGGDLAALAASGGKCEKPLACLKYDNMGRRYTAAGNSTLSLPDELKAGASAVVVGGGGGGGGGGGPGASFAVKQQDIETIVEQDDAPHALDEPDRLDDPMMESTAAAAAAAAAAAVADTGPEQAAAQRSGGLYVVGSDFVSL
uniref:Ig-like domain-containing protein n=1 Tax=Anopheles dirus TaxID=7168 RepID=A0A182N194_9DIPT